MPDQANQNLYALLQSRFSGRQGETFLEHDRGQLSFGALDEESARVAALLRAEGIGPGERVIAQVEKSPEAVVLYLGCLRAGAVFIPMNTAYTANELAYFIKDAGPALIICDPGRVSEMRAICGDAKLLALAADGGGSFTQALQRHAPDARIEPRAGNDLAAICYTSGTTGRSKGAMLTHANLSENALVLHRIWHFQPGDVLLHALPIFHVHGLFIALHCALLNASRVIFLPRFDLDRLIARLPDASVLMGVPTFYTRLLDDPRFTRALVANMRLFISGSAPLLEETFEQFEERCGHRILERYGMSEAGMITSNPYEGPRIAGTVGYALPGVEARVCDEAGGELARGEVGVLEIRGPNVFAGYWQMPEKTAQEFRDDGFFITGDLAIMAEDARISIVGRAKDMIISGGFNIYPKEVEMLVDALPGVLESAVIGVAHKDLGEAALAVVVPRKEAFPEPGEILAALEGKLARFKIPRAAVLAEELPRNTMGKVQKAALRARFGEYFTG